MPHGQLQLRCALQHVRLLHSEAQPLVKVRTTRVTMDGGALEATQTACRVGVGVGAGAGAEAAAVTVAIAGCQRHLDVRVDAAGTVGALQIATSYNCKVDANLVSSR